MNDEELDRLVRETDPYRPGLVAGLGGAEQALLEEIVSSAAPGRSRIWRTVAVFSAAAAIAGVVAVPSLLTAANRPEGPVPAMGFSASPGADLLEPGGDKVLLLSGQPGWKVTNVYGFAGAEGTIVLAKGKLSLDLTWYRADYYVDYYQDRLEVSAPAPGEVDGWTGDVFTYSDTDWELMLRPRKGVFVGLRTSGPWTRPGFDAMLAALRRVDPRTWLDALPADTVTPARAGRAAAQVLTGVPVPPGFAVSTAVIAGVNDPYQFGAQVIEKVGCGWLDEWNRAKKAGDAAAAKRAISALTSSRDWPVLKSMQAEGQYPEIFWEATGKIASADKSVGEYRSLLGCT